MPSKYRTQYVRPCIDYTIFIIRIVLFMAASVVGYTARRCEDVACCAFTPTREITRRHWTNTKLEGELHIDKNMRYPSQHHDVIDAHFAHDRKHPQSYILHNHTAIYMKYSEIPSSITWVTDSSQGENAHSDATFGIVNINPLRVFFRDTERLIIPCSTFAKTSKRANTIFRLVLLRLATHILHSDDVNNNNDDRITSRGNRRKPARKIDRGKSSRNSTEQSENWRKSIAAACRTTGITHENYTYTTAVPTG